MKLNWKSLSLTASVLLIGVVLAGCASGLSGPSSEMVQRIESARTRGDHEALAATYVQDAATARAKAVEHRKMAKSYQGMTTSGKGGAAMPAHCNSLVNLYESAATEYDGLAEGHRQMAVAAKP